MKEKLSTKKAIYLYGIILGFLFVFYLAALHFGSREDEPPVPEQQASELTEDLGENVQEKVEFYEELSKPLDSDVPQEAQSASKMAQAEAPQPKSQETRPQTGSAHSANSAGQFTVQVGAFSTEKEAQQMVVRLRTNNFNGRVLQPFGGTDQYYRVWVGEFPNRSGAAQAENDLKQAGFLTYIRKIP